MICTSTPFMKTIAYLNVLISTWKKYSYWIMTSDTVFPLHKIFNRHSKIKYSPICHYWNKYPYHPVSPYFLSNMTLVLLVDLEQIIGKNCPYFIINCIYMYCCPNIILILRTILK